MAVLQMRRVSICALKKNRKAILEELQSMGVLEISHIAEDDGFFEKMDTANARQGFEREAHTAEQALDVLDMYAPEKKSMLAGVEGKELVDREKFEAVIASKEEIAKTAHLLISKNKEIAECKAEISKLENQAESLNPWLSLDVPMDFAGTRKTAMLLGTMPGGATLEGIYAAVAENAPDTEGLDVHILASDKDAVYLAALCLAKDKEKTENALRAAGFAKPAQTASQTPKDLKESLERQVAELTGKAAVLSEEIAGYSDSREKLRILSDYFRVKAEKYEVLGSLPQSQRTFLISGYAAAKAVPAIQKAIGEKYDCVVDAEELKENEEPPTILENNSVSESVEGVLEAYGLPKKGEFDPTTIMSVFYIFFFGMMLSDAAYGAIISLACFALLKKCPRMDGGMKKAIKMFMYCGLSTLVWGVLFGGYFGDAVNVVSQKFWGTEVTVKALWFVPLDDPMRLLIYSMLFGLIHLFVGLGIKGYMCLKEGRIMDFFCDVALWYAFLMGLILMLLPTEIFASIAQTQIVFQPWVNTLAKALAVIGALGLFLMSGRANKNIGLRLALGAYDIYNVTGWLSDVLSYSRLLALGLATGVIASVVNQMAGMIGGGFIGAVAFIVIFIVGHTLNLAINLLGAYVHTNRLQFVEFFGKFYEGGGRAFEPFRADTKYVDIKEERL